MESADPPEISVAIFPFENLASSPEVEVIGRSFHIDLITQLSRYRQFRIVTPDDEPMRHPANYSIKGTFQVSNNKLKLNTRLINNERQQLTWADRYDLEEGVNTDTLDQLPGHVASALQHQLDIDLRKNIRKKSSSTLSPYEHWLHGMDELKEGTVVADERARVHFQHAIDIDPAYSLAYSGMSLSYFNEWSCQLWERWDVSQHGAYHWAQKAIDLDPQNYVAAMVLGRVYIYEAKYDIAEHYLRKALQLNANDADNLMQIAVCLVYLEKIDEAFNLYQKGVQLSHHSEEQYFYVGAFIAFEKRDFAECIRLSNKGPLPWVDSYEILAAAYYETGDMANMKATWDLFIAEFKRKILKEQRQPEDIEAIQWVINVSPYRGKSQQRRFWEYMGGKQATSSPRVFYEATPSAPNFFFREHDGWQMSYEGKILRLRQAKGLSDIAELLAKPNDQIHCTQLMGSGLEVKPQTIVDEKSMRAFRKRLVELQEEIALLEQQNNSGGLSSLHEEYDQLVDTIRAATGLGGRLRNMENPIDKIRSAVTWRIRSAIKKISDGHPALGKHLANSVRTGLFCSYSPEKSVTWAVER